MVKKICVVVDCCANCSNWWVDFEEDGSKCKVTGSSIASPAGGILDDCPLDDAPMVCGHSKDKRIYNEVVTFHCGQCQEDVED